MCIILIKNKIDRVLIQNSFLSPVFPSPLPGLVETFLANTILRNLVARFTT